MNRNENVTLDILCFSLHIIGYFDDHFSSQSIALMNVHGRCRLSGIFAVLGGWSMVCVCYVCACLCL